MSLGIGDMVKTGKGGGCAVVFSGGSVMRVMALAVIRVEQPSSGGLSINVAAGKTFMKVKKGAGNQNFSVTTPTAVAGVRGTSFSVGVKGGKGAKTGMKAMLTRPKGTVEVQKAGSEVWVKAAEGMLLQSGDSVKTAGSGNCALVWGKGNVVKVSPMSLISVDRLESDPFSGAGNVALNVKAGSLKAKTGKQSAPGAGFEIRTPTAVAGVRGTTVSVETGEDGASDVQCSEGLLEVSAVGGGTVEVKSGEKTKVVKDADPAPPVAMTPEEALKIDGDEDLKDSALETAAPEEEKAPPAETQFECADGELEVTSEAGDVVPVTAGQKVAMVEEAPPAPPVQMSTEEMTNFTAEGNLEEIKVDEAKPGEASGNAGEPGTAGAAGAATATVSTPVETEIQCVDGEVSVKAEGGEEVAVKTGEKTSIAENSPAPVEPKKMTAQEMNSFTAAVSEMNAAVEAPVSQAAGDEKEKNKDKEKESETGAAKQAAPLSLSVSSPSDGLVTKNSSVTVSGSTSPNAEVTINDVPVSSGKASFTGNVSLIEGDNTLNVTAKEGDNSMTTTLTVTKDTTAPTLTMIQPGAQFDIDSGGCVYSDGSMVCDIIGLTEPQAKLSINNSGVTVEADGSFTKTLTMDLKATTIEISVEDAVGNRKSTTLTRTLNLTKVMELRISADPGSITADGKSVATITVRGYNVLQEPAAGETEVTITAEPAAGTLSANTIMLHNGVGTVTYTTDSTDPVVTITATTPSGLTAETTLSVTPDPAKVTDLSISADPGGIAADGKSVSTITIRGFNARQEPAAGETEVTITAEPAAGTLSANSILLHNGVGTVTFTAGSAETTVTITAATTSGLTTATTLSITPATPPVRPFDW